MFWKTRDWKIYYGMTSFFPKRRKYKETPFLKYVKKLSNSYGEIRGMSNCRIVTRD